MESLRDQRMADADEFLVLVVYRRKKYALKKP